MVGRSFVFGCVALMVVNSHAYRLQIYYGDDGEAQGNQHGVKKSKKKQTATVAGAPPQALSGTVKMLFRDVAAIKKEQQARNSFVQPTEKEQEELKQIQQLALSATSSSRGAGNNNNAEEIPGLSDWEIVALKKHFQSIEEAKNRYAFIIPVSCSRQSLYVPDYMLNCYTQQLSRESLELSQQGYHLQALADGDHSSSRFRSSRVSSSADTTELWEGTASSTPRTRFYMTTFTREKISGHSSVSASRDCSSRFSELKSERENITEALAGKYKIRKKVRAHRFCNGPSSSKIANIFVMAGLHEVLSQANPPNDKTCASELSIVRIQTETHTNVSRVSKLAYPPERI
ncbi:unnamed protein product [Phytophthora fragariaefolia]|uniref:Unnamed protein product n=1 Tax=Phytophthora fragariaefolia TaxID=1490495 RepID=A0A9W7DAT7_9STRA|nr:unnamed protein product [Phytophthora fragariaefolia]